MSVFQLTFKFRREGWSNVLELSQVAEGDKLINGKGLNHRLKNVGESDAAHTKRSGSDAEEKSVWEGVKDFLVSVGQNVMAFVTDKKVGVESVDKIGIVFAIVVDKPTSESLNGSDLNGRSSFILTPAAIMPKGISSWRKVLAVWSISSCL